MCTRVFPSTSEKRLLVFVCNFVQRQRASKATDTTDQKQCEGEQK